MSNPEVLLNDFDPSPSKGVMRKYDYFFQGYNPKVHREKHMQFSSDKNSFWISQIQHILQTDSDLSYAEKKQVHSYLQDI